MAAQRQPTERELTPAEARALSMKYARSTLENKVFQGIIGSGEILSNQARYGSDAVETAKPAYDEAITSDEAKKIRDGLYKKLREEGKKKGIYARPSVNDYDVERHIRDQVEENKLLLPLKDLVSIVQGINPGVKAIPKELEAYVPIELAKKIAETHAKNPERSEEDVFKSALNEEEQVAFALYQRLSRAYNTLSAYKISDTGALTEINSFIDQISEKYKQPEKNK